MYRPMFKLFHQVVYHVGMTTNVTRFYKTNPNCTSSKIELTPPVDSYTIVLLVLTLSTTQGWLVQQTSFLGGVKSLNDSFWPCEGPSLARISDLLVDGLIMLVKYILNLVYAPPHSQPKASCGCAHSFCYCFGKSVCVQSTQLLK